jgi:hypothetical protein
MQYVLLIYADEARGAAMSEPEQEAVMAAYYAFGDKYQDQIVEGKALLNTPSATTVRLRDGKTLSTDGPFAETKEQLGGFYIVECKDLDEAIQIAADIPDAAHGSIEIRPPMIFD